MKKKIVFVYFLFIGFSSLGQNARIDSLRTKYNTATNSLIQFNILDKLSLEMANTVGSYVDSTACFRMLQIAQELNNDSLFAVSYNWIGTYFYVNKGDYALGLEYYYKGIPFAQRAQDNRRISSLYFDIALVYFDMQNNEEAANSTRKGGQYLPPKAHPMYHYMLVQYQINMAQYFLLVNQLDSAFYYAQSLIETNQKIKMGAIIFHLSELTYNGSVYARRGDIKMADAYFEKALFTLNEVESSASKFQFYIFYIPFLLNQNRILESGNQAKDLLNMGIENNNNAMMQAASGYLRQVFETQNQLDSAYYYSKMESELNTLINNQNNKNKIQTLAISEQLRSQDEERKQAAYRNQIKLYTLLGGLAIIMIVALVQYRNNRQKQQANKFLSRQKEEIQIQKEKVEKALSELKSTQSQLIQSEKMASLGELTAGIAHEIQNPLNFVNNFSEVNTELIDELKKELVGGNTQLAEELVNDIKSNSEKINHHGKRAGDIVKGMLQHSRSSSGVKEPTDINTLVDEYLRLAYHGLRAKNKSFNAIMKTEFDKTIGSINVVPQDIGRVILNLITNAFYVVNEKSKTGLAKYEPTVTVSTKKVGDQVLISVRDNGNGIPESIKEKIFQPFFTTKPTGQGTGLGLSLSYDIVKAHDGELKVETKAGEGTTFIILIPLM
jgi:signal transduction histidine kinase